MSPSQKSGDGGAPFGYRLVLSYDGTDYCGWQRQPRKRTIQGEIEAALARIFQKSVAVTGAGRTDAGVHALGQAASFKVDRDMPEAELFKALNALLPDDIRAVSLVRVPAGFNARRDAEGKIYQYRIWTSRAVSPFAVRYVLHWPYPLNVSRMRAAAALFAREGDFTGFSSNRVLPPVRSVVRSELSKRGDEIIYTVEARGFLRYMVRTMVGTLLEVGRGRIPVTAIEEIFRDKKRTLASPTAPAKGLCLVKVIY
jgi:tRNA pseudouridine38-40 synthase